MTTLGKLILSTAIAGSGVLIVAHAGSAMDAARPTDMPADAAFLQSGYNVSQSEPRGTWVACRMDPNEEADFCRVTDAKGTIVYQGAFLPYDSQEPLPQRDLRVISINPDKMWVVGPAAGGPVPIIPLANGRVLVPSADRYALQQRWANDATELTSLGTNVL